MSDRNVTTKICEDISRSTSGTSTGDTLSTIISVHKHRNTCQLMSDKSSKR